jgi:hypothetical protein
MQPLGRPLGKQGLGGLGGVDGAVVQPQMRWNVRIALGRQSVPPGPEICAAHTPLLEPHAHRFEIEVTAPDAIEPGACAGLHLMGMRLTFGRPGLRRWRVFREAALIAEKNTNKTGSFLSQMCLNVFAGLLKPLGVSLFLSCSVFSENSCPRASMCRPKRSARSFRSWAPVFLA